MNLCKSNCLSIQMQIEIKSADRNQVTRTLGCPIARVQSVYMSAAARPRFEERVSICMLQARSQRIHCTFEVATAAALKDHSTAIATKYFTFPSLH